MCNICLGVRILLAVCCWVCGALKCMTLQNRITSILLCWFSVTFVAFFFGFSFSLLQNFLSAPPTPSALRRVKLFRTLGQHKSHRRGQFVLFLKYLHDLANSSWAAKSTITQKRNFSTVREPFLKTGSQKLLLFKNQNFTIFYQS